MNKNQNPPGIPPLAGLATYAEAARAGYSVERSVDLLRRYNYVEKRLYEISAAHINPRPEAEVKAALSLHLWLDAEHSQALRGRVAEMRRPPLYLDKVPAEGLRAWLDEAIQSQDTVELLVALFRVVRPALLAAYRQYQAETNPIFDHPTCRLLRLAVQEEEQMIEWGEAALAAVAQGAAARQAAAAWERHLRAYLAAAGGISGQAAVPPGLQLPAPRAAAPYVPSVAPQRVGPPQDVYNFSLRSPAVYHDEAADLEERILALMYTRLHELDVPEVIASIVLQTPDKPWAYYVDMGRQTWDEARHVLMGEVWFAARGVDWSRYPNDVGWSLYLNLDRSPLERHAILYAVEQGLMDARTGKRFQWEISRESDDALATAAQDYDWADEVLHAQIGARWLKAPLGGQKAAVAFAAAAAKRPTPVLDEHARLSPQDDWWPRLVRDVLGRDSTSMAAKDFEYSIPALSD